MKKFNASMTIDMLMTIHTPLRLSLILLHTSLKKGILKANNVYALSIRHIRVSVPGVCRDILIFLNVSFHMV